MSAPDAQLKNCHIGPYVLIKPLRNLVTPRYLAKHSITNQVVVIKELLFPKEEEDSQKTLTNNDLTGYGTSSHPYIAQLFETIEFDNCYYLVIEYPQNGTLLSWVTRRGTIPIDQVKMLAAQLILAISYLHQDLHIFHRAICPENIYIDRNGNIRLVNFTSCTTFTDNSDFFTERLFKTNCEAPEIIEDKPYTTAIDIWGLGSVIYFACTGLFPFYDAEATNLQRSNESINHKIMKDELQYPADFPEDLRSLLKKLFKKNPDLRPKIDLLFNEPFFADVDFQALTQMPTVTEIEVTSFAATQKIPFLMNSNKPDNNTIRKLITSELTLKKCQIAAIAVPHKIEIRPKRRLTADKIKYLDGGSDQDLMKALARRIARKPIDSNKLQTNSPKEVIPAALIKN